MNEVKAHAVKQAAPVALFVHSRVDHTRRTLAALAKNNRARETPLYVFADAARNAREMPAVQAVRKLVSAASGFKSVEVIERERNLGLARNIVDGVTSVIQRHGKVIVLEDDLVTGCHFLEFLNDALDRYADESRVWHINAWTYPIDVGANGRPFFTSVMECWGWATWADRWAHFQKNPDEVLRSFTPDQVRRFNINGGYNYWEDVKRNAHGTMNTWAVFWYATIFRRGGLCLSPPQSHVVNIGIDGSGANSGSADIYAATVVSGTYDECWPTEMAANENAFQAIGSFLSKQRPPLWRRLASRCKWILKSLAVRHST
jgi:hypothetical protein